MRAPADDVLAGLPARWGHFLLESGLHTDLWFTLDALFVEPREVASRVAALAALLAPYGVSAVCGPLLGGAFLAHALAAHLGVRFYATAPGPADPAAGLFAAEYRLTAELRRRVGGERVAVVDDVISAGSSVRATVGELEAAGATTAVVGALLLLGGKAVDHFAARGIPLVAHGRREHTLWEPATCPLCAVGVALEDPVASSGGGRAGAIDSTNGTINGLPTSDAPKVS